MTQGVITAVRWQLALGLAGAAVATGVDLPMQSPQNADAAASLMRDYGPGIAGLLLQIAGFWGVSTALGDQAFWGRLYGRITISSYALGAAFLALRVGLDSAAAGNHAALALPTLCGFLTGMALFVWRVSRGGTLFPRAMAPASQLGLVVVALAALPLAPVGRDVLLTCGLNFCSTWFFACALLSFARSGPTRTTPPRREPNSQWLPAPGPPLP
ncbi:MAG: hypothetical protein ABI609_06235 [Acidobacteriota bacterium]